MLRRRAKMTSDGCVGGVLPGLDVMAAIQVHVQWKQRLLAHIRDPQAEPLDPDVVGSDRLCELGQWIHGQGEAKYGEHPGFQTLKAMHAEFHACAADVIHAVERGEQAHALKLLQVGEYPKVSNRIKSMLAGLSLDFDFR